MAVTSYSRDALAGAGAATRCASASRRPARAFRNAVLQRPVDQCAHAMAGSAQMLDQVTAEKAGGAADQGKHTRFILGSSLPAESNDLKVYPAPRSLSLRH